MRCIVLHERDRTREKERKSDAERGRDACYETTARESPKRREEERREPVGRAFCASGRSFSISPPPILPPVRHLLLSFSLVLPFSIPRFSILLSLFRALHRFSLSLRLLSSLLFSPFLPPIILPFPLPPTQTPSTFRYHLGARLGLK